MKSPNGTANWPTVSRSVEFAGLVGVLGLAVWVYRGAFLGFFVQDDYGWLESSRFSSVSEYVQIFFRFNPALSYRPLSQETYFCLSQLVFGKWPPGFHLVSVWWHLLGSALVYLLSRQFFQVLPSLAGTVFFALHGALLVSIYWISALPEPMALVFYLTAVILFIRFDRKDDRRAYAGSIAAMILGVMSKESILTLPLILAAYCAFFAPRRALWTAPHLMLTGLYVFFRSTSRVVAMAPYPLNFGLDAWQNLLTFLSWTAGFTETLLKVRLEWSLERSYPWIAASFAVAVFLLFIFSRNKRAAGFAIVWYLLALQPVLYFSGHIYAYYLGAALPAMSLLLASAVPASRRLPDWRSWVVALTIVCYCAWFSVSSVKREGRWWNERAHVGREILEKMPALDRQVPDGRMAYIFGFGEWELGILQNDAAFKAFGFSTDKFILMGLNDNHRIEIRNLEKTGGLRDYYCFVYAGGQFINTTNDFREDPETFLQATTSGPLDFENLRFQQRPEVRLEARPGLVRVGKDHLELSVINLEAQAIDILYSIDGSPMPPLYRWRLDENRKARVFVDNRTPKGLYLLKAIRDSRDPSPHAWIRVDAEVLVQ